MAADVYLKNIPLSYLKRQTSSFFEASKFNAAVSLFNTKKRPMPVTQAEAVSLDSQILPLTKLKTILLDLFDGTELTDSSYKDEEDRIFIKYSGKYLTDNEYSPRKQITRTASQIKTSMVYAARRYTNNAMLTALKKSRKNTSTSNLINNPLLVKLRPAKTANVLRDISNSANFFQRTYHPDVYDNNAYQSDVYKQIAYNVDVSIQTVSVSTLKKKLDDKYRLKNKELTRMVADVKAKLLHKFFDFDTPYFSVTNLSEMTTSEWFTNVNKVIDSVIATKAKSLPVTIFQYPVITFTSSVTISHMSGIAECLVATFDDSGVSKNDTITNTVRSLNSTTVTFNAPFKGVILLMFDTDVGPNIYAKKFTIYQTESTDKILDRYTTYVSGTEFSLDIAGLDQGYGFIRLSRNEAASENHGEVITPSFLQITPDSVNIELPVGWVNVLVEIIPTYRVLRGISNVRVSKTNIRDFLQRYDIFDEDLHMWRESDR